MLGVVASPTPLSLSTHPKRGRKGIFWYGPEGDSLLQAQPNTLFLDEWNRKRHFAGFSKNQIILFLYLWKEDLLL
jgi:hypothetical protein